MASTELESITGVWGHRQGPGAELLVRGSGGEAAEAKRFFVLWYA